MRYSKEKYLFYIGTCMALLPVILLRDFTPANELRYLSIADEALRNHTFFAFANHGVPYADKPPLYFWIIMLCRLLTGAHRIWLLSLFSLVPALVIVRTMDRWITDETDAGGRSTARVMTLTCGMFMGAAVVLRMDMLMCMFIVLALRSFWQMFRNEDRRSRWTFPLYLFLALFTKGPLGLAIPLCCTAVFLVVSRRAGEFFRYWGWRTWGILLACCAIWFSATYAEGGGDYLRELLFHQTIGRAVNSFHHGEPFYYYAVSIWYIMAPWSLLVACAVAAALKPRFVRSDLQRFFLTVGISTFVLLSCVSSKLQVYMLPAVPFLACSASMAISRFRNDKLVRVALAIPAAILVAALPALVLLASSEATSYLDIGMLYAAATILTLSGLQSLYLLYSSKRETDTDNIVRRMGAGLLLAVFTGGWALPKLNAHIGYGALCDKALEISREQGISDLRTWRISRSENMDVYLSRPVRVVPAAEQPMPEKGHPFLLLVRKHDLAQFSGRETQVVGDHAVVVFR